jgi:bifunctional non-homologous end joining protein LigD
VRAFDILEFDGQDLRPQPYHQRLVRLFNFFNRPGLRHIRLVHTAIEPEAKARSLQRLRTEKMEGVVFKRLDAAYTRGRPNIGGAQFKHKFHATCSAYAPARALRCTSRSKPSHH